MNRTLKVVAIVIGILLVILIAIPFFINANSYRPKIEAELTSALGRDTKVGNLSLSLFSGGVTADNISIADDPQFSKGPFVQAKSLRVGVEILPLIFSRTLNVTDLTLNDPEIALIKSEDGARWNFSSLGNAPGTPPAGQTPGASAPAKSTPEPANASTSTAGRNPNLSVAKLNVKNGRVTVSRAGSDDKPRVYDKVNIEVKNFSFASSFPFQMTAQLPAGGSMKLDGEAGPINATDAAETPMDAKISIQKMNLAASGFIDPSAGIAGIADLDGNVTSDGHQAKLNATLKVSNLQVVAKGSPAGRPVDVTLAITHDVGKETGSITQGDIVMGKAVAHLTGTYDAHGKVAAVNLKLNAGGMPVDDLEAMLPALGVVLPPKATLKGGTVNAYMDITGPVNQLVTTGKVQMQDATLSNFDLGSEMSSISALSGKKTGNDTVIQNFSSDVKVAPAGTDANNINLNVPSIGVITGGGTVSPANQLAFKMKAEVAGMGVPFSIEGTTADPKFVPDVRGMATGLVKGVMGKDKNPMAGLGGLLKK
jgi:AsmA protein